MAVTKYTQDMKVGASAKRMFKAFTTECDNIVPKANPGMKSLDIIQGDGGVGTIRQGNHPDGSHIKHRIDIFDPDKYVSKFTVLEGSGVGDKFESINYTLEFKDASDGGCIVRKTTEYHMKGEIELKEEEIKGSKDQDPTFYKLIGDYLVAHPQLCT